MGDGVFGLRLKVMIVTCVGERVKFVSVIIHSHTEAVVGSTTSLGPLWSDCDDVIFTSLPHGKF